MKFKNLKDAIQTSGLETFSPELHIVLGSGLAGALEESTKLNKSWSTAGEISFSDLQSIPQTSVAGHKGSFKFLRHTETNKVLVLQTGRLHGYEGHDPKIVVQPLIESFDLGCRNFVLTNAAGSLKTKWKPGSAMIISDQVNFTGKNPLIGPNPKDAHLVERGPRFPDMSRAYSKALNSLLKSHLKKHLKNVYEGTYIGVLGPNFETPAEIKLFSKWGLGSVGMSTVWEAIALAHVGANVGGVSFLSNLGSGLSKKPLSHEEVLETGKKSASLMLKALLSFADAQFKSAAKQNKKTSKKAIK